MKSFRFSALAMFLLVGAAVFVLVERTPLEAQGRRTIVWEHQIIRMGFTQGDPETKLQEAGAQGWECVGLAFNTHGGTSNGVCFVMKRQKDR